MCIYHVQRKNLKECKITTIKFDSIKLKKKKTERKLTLNSKLKIKIRTKYNHLLPQACAVKGKSKTDQSHSLKE